MLVLGGSYESLEEISTSRILRGRNNSFIETGYSTSLTRSPPRLWQTNTIGRRAFAGQQCTEGSKASRAVDYLPVSLEDTFYTLQSRLKYSPHDQRCWFCSFVLYPSREKSHNRTVRPWLQRYCMYHIIYNKLTVNILILGRSSFNKSRGQHTSPEDHVFKLSPPSP